MIVKIKQAVLVVGDIILMYGALALALLIRYGTINQFLIDAHLGPFTVVFVLWVAICYIVGLYDLTGIKSKIHVIEQGVTTVGSGTVLAIVLFYLIPYFSISPKRNLALFALLFLFLLIGWRLLFMRISRAPQRRVLIMGSGTDVETFETFLLHAPQLGYKVVFQIKQLENATPQSIRDIIKENQANTVVITRDVEKIANLYDELLDHLRHGVEIVDITSAYETLLKKVPVAQLKEFWVLTNFSRKRGVYETVKRPLEFVIALALFVILLPLLIIIWALVKLSSQGPGIYTQVRVGKNETRFSIFKFRTMRVDAEKNGVAWARPDDPRVTMLGRFLRFSHLDELPQLWNIIRGDISFVGPRPERPEFIQGLKEKIPYYDVRHIIKPGVTGWAQVNFRYGSSIEDAQEKLQYDLYYAKHRSLTLDFLILLKTLKMFLFNYR